MTYEDKASYDSTPPCNLNGFLFVDIKDLAFQLAEAAETNN